MAGALGDRWAIRTQAPDGAAAVDAAEAAGDVAAMRAIVPPNRMVIVASRERLLSSLMVTSFI
jgi:hypothetical protein